MHGAWDERRKPVVSRPRSAVPIWIGTVRRVTAALHGSGAARPPIARGRARGPRPWQERAGNQAVNLERVSVRSPSTKSTGGRSQARVDRGDALECPPLPRRTLGPSRSSSSNASLRTYSAPSRAGLGAGRRCEPNCLARPEARTAPRGSRSATQQPLRGRDFVLEAASKLQPTCCPSRGASVEQPARPSQQILVHDIGRTGAAASSTGNQLSPLGSRSSICPKKRLDTLERTVARAQGQFSTV